MSSTPTREEQVLQHVEEKRAWYDRNATRTMHWYQRLRVTGLASTVLVPIFALTPGAALWPKIAAAVLAAVAAFAQGLEGIHLYREHYVTWRYTAEQIERVVYDYRVEIGDFAADKNVADPTGLLAERVEALTSQENQQWLSTQEKSDATSVVKGSGGN